MKIINCFRCFKCVTVNCIDVILFCPFCGSMSISAMSVPLSVNGYDPNYPIPVTEPPVPFKIAI